MTPRADPRAARRGQHPGRRLRSLTIILNTGGCRWARAGGCTMCGYVAESVEGGTVAHEALMDQIQVCLDHEAEEMDDGEKAGLIKIYTSGSFLDEREVPRRRVRLSPRPSPTVSASSSSRCRTSSTRRPSATSSTRSGDGRGGGSGDGDRPRPPRLREQVLRLRGLRGRLRGGAAAGGGVKAYLLMKPPFLSEPEALDDMKSSIRRCAAVDGCHTVSMNPRTSSATRWSTSCTSTAATARRGSGRSPTCWSDRRRGRHRRLGPGRPRQRPRPAQLRRVRRLGPGASRTSTSGRTRRCSTRCPATARRPGSCPRTRAQLLAPARSISAASAETV